MKYIFFLLIDNSLQPNSLYRAARFANFEGILGFSVSPIILLGRGYANNNATRSCDSYETMKNRTENDSKISKKIAIESGIFVEGRMEGVRCKRTHGKFASVENNLVLS